MPNTTTERDGSARQERLGFRMSEETKRLIERAAYLEHRKVTDFCLVALTDAAKRSIAEHETLALSEGDRAAFFAALENPPEPHPRLVKAMAEQQRRIGR